VQRFVSVARTSSYKQKDNTSQENQFKVNKNLVDSFQGVLVKEFYDNESGTIFEREGLQSALELIQSGQADVLVYYDVSRMMRSDDVFIKTLESIYKSKGKLAVATKGIIYPTLDEAIIQLFWDKNVAVYEHLQTRIRTRNGSRITLEKGGWRGRPPFGYQLKPTTKDGIKIKVLEPDPLESDALNTFFDFLISGVGKVQAVKFTQETYPHKYFNRAIFHRAMNKIEKYVGREPFELKYEEFSADYYAVPLISEDKYEKVKEVKVRKRSSKSFRPVAYKGIARCMKCGKSLCLRGSTGSRNWNLYSCASYVSYFQAKTYKNEHLMEKHKNYCRGMISQKRLNDAVYGYFNEARGNFSQFDALSILVEDDLSINLSEQDKLKAKIEELKDEREALIQKIVTLNQLTLSSVAQVIEERLKQIDSENKEINDALKSLKKQQDGFNTFLKIYNNQNVYENIGRLVYGVLDNNKKVKNDEEINKLLYSLGVCIVANPETYEIQIGVMSDNVQSMLNASREGDKTLATSIQKTHSYG
jgi:DNA invertase Pin-like site-specific DNA recombinase